MLMKNMILGGIRQGCATATLTFLFSGLDFAGTIGLNGCLSFQNESENVNSILQVCEFYFGDNGSWDGFIMLKVDSDGEAGILTENL